MDERLKEAESLYKQGNKSQAAKLLAEIVRQDPNNYMAWYGLALSLDEYDKKAYCLKKVLSLNPSHQKAQQLLEKLVLEKNLSFVGSEQVAQPPAQKSASGNLRKETLDKPTDKILLFVLIGAGLLILICGSIAVVTNLKKIQAQNAQATVGAIYLQEQYAQATVTFMPKPTFTPRPTITPSPSITVTPTPRFQNKAEFYTPKLENMPQNFYAISVGYNYTSQGDEFYQAIFENPFPNIKGTDDAYLVSYEVMVFPNKIAAQNLYNGFDAAFIASLDSSATSAPIETAITIQDVEEAKMFLIHIRGVNVPGIICIIIVRDENLEANIQTLVHDTGNSVNKAINQAQYFASLLTAKLK